MIAIDFLLIGDGGDGTVLASLDAFLASYASIGVLDVDVLVNTEVQHVNLAENLFRASLVTFPTSLAVVGIDCDVICLKLFHCVAIRPQR